MHMLIVTQFKNHPVTQFKNHPPLLVAESPVSTELSRLILIPAGKEPGFQHASLFQLLPTQVLSLKLFVTAPKTFTSGDISQQKGQCQVERIDPKHIVILILRLITNSEAKWVCL